MIANIKMYTDEQADTALIGMSQMFYTYWEAACDDTFTDWVKNYGYNINGLYVIELEALIDFEDFLRETYGDYPDELGCPAIYRSHAFTFEFAYSHELRFFDAD